MAKKEKTKTKNNNKRKLEEEEDKPKEKQENRTKKSRNSNKNNNIVTDDRFKSVHFDPRFQRVPKKESKVPIDSRFKKLLSGSGFGSSKAAVDKRGRVKKESNNLSKYYVHEDEGRKKEEEERESGESEIGESSPSSSDDEEEDDIDYGDDGHLDLITQYLMARHEDTPSTDQETYRLAIVNMDWDHIKAVDLYVALSSCLPRGGQILSVGIYPSEHGLKCMEVEAVKGPFALIDSNEEHSEDESESDDENLQNEQLRTYELNKLRYYHGVVVFDSSATANHVYKALDGTELLSTSNVFDLRFIPDSMEFKHPPRDIITEAPTSYNEPDFHTRALQHSNVKLTWEDDEPRRTKVLRRKFNPDELDEVNEYLASSGDSDADDEVKESEGSENEEIGSSCNGKVKKHMDKEKLRSLLLSGGGSGSDKDDDQDMEITFNTGLEDLSKRILEKNDKKSKTVWEQVLQKRSEKRKARKNRSKHSSDDDSSDFDVQEEEAEQPDDFFMEEEPSDSKTKNTEKSKRGKSSGKERVESSDIDKEREASKAELELLFAEDQDGKGDGAKGYKLKPKKKVKGRKGKEALVKAKLPNVDPSEDPRFSALFTSHLYALDPTDPQFKRSAAYARQQLRTRKTDNKMEELAEETMNASRQVQTISNDTAPIEKEKYELSSTVKSLKRNLGNLKKGTKSR